VTFEFSRAWRLLAGSIVVLLVASLAALADPVPPKTCLAKPRSKFLIVLDVGHTPREPGALSARGVSEYNFNLALATRIEKELRTAGFSAARVLKIVKPGSAGLKERPDLANRWKADLFLSIHHDSVQPSYLLPWQFNGKRLNYSDEFSGYSLFLSRKNGGFPESARFATALADQLRAAGRSFTRHHSFDLPGERRTFIDEERGIYRYDELAVLRLTTMPAILFEAGVIVNRQDEELAASAAYRDTVATAFSAALDAFCQPPTVQN
jgi:N-acetylmuramoyl-L-alanine amidase